MLKTIFIVFCIPALFFFSSCKKNDKEKTKQHLSINILSEPQSLNPLKARDLIAVNLAKMFFDGLMRVDNDGNILPGIAQSYEISDDGKIYSFFLRDSFWSNGDKLTAHDFEYTFKKVLSPNFITSNAASLFKIKNAKKAKEGEMSLDEIGIKALNDTILEIELEKPCSYFLRLLTQPAFFAINKNVDKKNKNWALNKNTFVSNGVFKLSEWKKNDIIEAKKNEFYWDKDKVKLEKISMLMLPNGVEQNMFELHELDIAGSPFSTITLDSLEKLKKDKSFHIEPYFGTSFLRINTQQIRDLNFRKDLRNSFDREKITKHILQGGQLSSSRLIPVDKNINVPIIKKDYSQKEFTLMYVSNDRTHILAQALQGDLSKNLNLNIKLLAVERKTYYEKISNLDYELAISSWIADLDDPIDFLNVFKYRNSSTNNTGWENENYINLLEESEKILDLKKREKVLFEAEDILLTEAPIVPIYHLTQNFLKKENLEDVFIYPSGFIDFKYAHFE
ncbi:MAG: hypothetical protein KR126chlam5_01581, partial [Candidatus Anoxychlamydiales bacterium]|nr:hypothetical protein [Candidatus Anoxychlamydiales bacterium]